MQRPGWAEFLPALAVLFAMTAVAQTSRGTVTGVIIDASRSGVPGAAVEITNKETNVTRDTKTNEQGIYRFDAVDLGTYDVTVKSTGFKVYTSRDVPVSAAQTVAVDAQLEVGDNVSVVEVTSDAIALQTEAPVRGGNISTVLAVQLPVNGSRNPNMLAITLPGVTEQRFGPGISTFSVNGSRGRSNNFLLDGTENNDISVAGQGFQIRNPEAVQEVSVQTANYDAEFGRAGGAVINTITRSGTNALHGSVNWLADFTNDDAITNTLSSDPGIRERGKLPPGYEQYYSAALGGPIIKDRTFFFTSWTEQRRRSTTSAGLVTLSAAGRAKLRSLFPQGSNPRADLYLDVTKGLEATGQFTSIDLGPDRGAAEFGTAVLQYSDTFSARQSLTKLDHKFSDSDMMSIRYAYDRPVSPIATLNFPGFQTSNGSTYHNAVITETHIFSPTLTNELRLPFNRIEYSAPNDAANPIAETLPRYVITSITAIGVSPSYPQGRIANNYIIQDTMSAVRGNHTLRFGLDLLFQRSRQTAPAIPRGQLDYRGSSISGGYNYSAFANFLDDFGGSQGGATRDFGTSVYYPDFGRQSYFFQDRWRVQPNLTLTLGVRWEDFGTPMNSLPTPAYAGLFNITPGSLSGPYAQPNKVSRDLNNFAPVVGATWSPSFGDGLLGRIFGDRRTVFRSGFNLGYDSFFNNIASNIATSAPNIVSTSFVSIANTVNLRGAAGLSGLLPQVPRDVRPVDAQNLVTADLVNPYTMKWTFGLQRELPWHMILDASYVGSSGVRLYINEDLNPLVPVDLRVLPAGFSSLAELQAVTPYTLESRLDPLQGSRIIRTNGGHSIYHSGQFELNKRFDKGLFFRAAYTWSKLIDNASEIFTFNNTSSVAAIPSIFGGQRNERAVSLYDRPHRLVYTWIYELPWMKNQSGPVGRVLGGWALSGSYTYESGVPYSIGNGQDADGLGGALDRADFNPSGRPGVRAIPSTSSTTGWRNPDILGPDGQGIAIERNEAQFLAVPAGSGRTGNLGRNTQRVPGINNWQAYITKNVRLTERFSFEFRTEMYNVFNHPQYGYPGVSPFVPGEGTIASTVYTSAQGRFANPIFLDAGGRAIRYQLTLRF